MENSTNESKKSGGKKGKKNNVAGKKKSDKKNKSKKVDSTATSSRIEKLAQPKPKTMKPIKEETEIGKKLNINLTAKTQMNTRKDTKPNQRIEASLK